MVGLEAASITMLNAAPVSCYFTVHGVPSPHPTTLNFSPDLSLSLSLSLSVSLSVCLFLLGFFWFVSCTEFTFVSFSTFISATRTLRFPVMPLIIFSFFLFWSESEGFGGGRRGRFWEKLTRASFFQLFCICAFGYNSTYFLSSVHLLKCTVARARARARERGYILWKKQDGAEVTDIYYYNYTLQRHIKTKLSKMYSSEYLSVCLSLSKRRAHIWSLSVWIQSVASANFQKYA